MLSIRVDQKGMVIMENDQFLLQNLEEIATVLGDLSFLVTDLAVSLRNMTHQTKPHPWPFRY